MPQWTGIASIGSAVQYYDVSVPLWKVEYSAVERLSSRAAPRYGGYSCSKKFRRLGGGVSGRKPLVFFVSHMFQSCSKHCFMHNFWCGIRVASVNPSREPLFVVFNASIWNSNPSNWIIVINKIGWVRPLRLIISRRSQFATIIRFALLVSQLPNRKLN